MKPPVLEIKDLVCGYDSKTVLHNVSFKVEVGELIGIIGPNGSGKTTLLRAASRVLRPRSGAVILEGEDICRMRFKEVARRIAVVSQFFEAGVMSVEEFVLLGRIPYYKRFQFLETKTDLEIATRCMKLTGISKLKDQFINQISGGEAGLVMIARALTQEPRLLLLDEPTAHLDITHKIEILDLIKRLNKDYTLTVLMVMHDLNLASEYCDKLILLDKGRVSEMGLPQEVLDYRVIERVYKTVVVVRENPVTGKPYVFLVPGSKTKIRKEETEDNEIS